MAQLVMGHEPLPGEETLPCEATLTSPAKKVYDIYRRKCYLFPTIMPQDIQAVDLLKLNWDSLHSERRWTFKDGACGSWTDIVEAFDDQTKSITFALLDGEVPKMRYKSLKVDQQFFPHGEGCKVEVELTFVRQNDSVPLPNDYANFICKMLKAVDTYLHSNPNDA